MRRGLKPPKKNVNVELGRRIHQTSVTKIYHRRSLGVEPPAAGGYRCLGAKPPAAGRFLVVLKKKRTYFNAIGSQFARVQSHLTQLDF